VQDTAQTVTTGGDSTGIIANKLWEIAAFLLYDVMQMDVLVLFRLSNWCLQSINQDFNSRWQTATRQIKINTNAEINFKKMYNDKQ